MASLPFSKGCGDLALFEGLSISSLEPEALHVGVGASCWQGFSPIVPLLCSKELTKLLVLLGVDIQWWRAARGGHLVESVQEYCELF